MKQLTLHIPDRISLSEREAKRFLAAKMYEMGKLTLAQGAELAGLSTVTFSEILGDYDVSFINHDPSDIISDAQSF